jgi:hypothetical protein
MFVDTSKKTTSSSTAKDQLLTYQVTGQTDEESSTDQMNPSKTDTGIRYWRSKSFLDSGDTSDDSSLEDKSYGPTDLSLIFGDPNKKDNVTYTGEEERRERATSWRNPSSSSSMFGDRGDGREGRWDSAERCTRCRSQVPQGARYCPNCGESVR